MCLLAEITPSQHTKTQTFLKSQNLIRHWITSFALVEHEVSLRPFAGPVQSPNGHKRTSVVDWTRAASVKERLRSGRKERIAGRGSLGQCNLPGEGHVRPTDDDTHRLHCPDRGG